MKLLNKETGLELIIDENLIQHMSEAGKEKLPNEFGGILVGRYINNMKTVLIEETVLPVKYNSSPYSFERGSERLYQILERYYKMDPKRIYVGEWHTHPNSPATPSHQDLKAMKDLVVDKNVTISNPVLLIISINGSFINAEIYIFSDGRLLPYQKI